jgi:rubrerythrin
MDKKEKINVTLRHLLMQEEDAAQSYIKSAYEIDDEKISKLLLDIAKEEIKHKGELTEALKTIGVDDEKVMDEGEYEAKEKLAKF